MSKKFGIYRENDFLVVLNEFIFLYLEEFYYRVLKLFNYDIVYF